MRRYERKDPHSPWRQVGDPVKAVVGRLGLGWGRGLHPEPPPDGPQKKEGDGKAPAGIFSLGASFGLADFKDVGWLRLPYRRVTADIKCIDDDASGHYNKIVAASEVAPDWKSHEEMLREDGQYRLGIVVGHNTNPVMAGAGSCIFLHIWKEPAEGDLRLHGRFGRGRGSAAALARSRIAADTDPASGAGVRTAAPILEPALTIGGSLTA